MGEPLNKIINVFLVQETSCSTDFLLFLIPLYTLNFYFYFLCGATVYMYICAPSTQFGATGQGMKKQRYIQKSWDWMVETHRQPPRIPSHFFFFYTSELRRWDCYIQVNEEADLLWGSNLRLQVSGRRKLM